jgi:hypothetical protein
MFSRLSDTPSCGMEPALTKFENKSKTHRTNFSAGGFLELEC